MPLILLQRSSNIPLMVIWLETNTIYFHPAKVACSSYKKANEYQLKNTAKIPYGVYKTCNSWVTPCECPPPPHIPGTSPAVPKSWHWHPTSLGETIQKTPTNTDKGFLSKAQECGFHPQPCVGAPEVSMALQRSHLMASTSETHKTRSVKENEQLAHASSALTSLPQGKNGPSPEVPCILLK